MNVKWLLEPEVFKGEEDPLMSTLTKLGVEYETVKFGTPYKDYLSCFKESDCVVFHGSMQLGQLIQKETKWTPGVYCNLPKLECTYYYPRLQSLLNDEYLMLPFGELARRKDFLFEAFGEELFIRPSSGYKTFTGSVVTKKTYEEIKSFKMKPEDIVIAAPVTLLIEKEWRLVVVDNKVIAASQYKTKERPAPPQEVWDYAQARLDEFNYHPDSVWVLDICRMTDGMLYILEAGSFSCCGLYDCDPETVIQEVSKAAWRDYSEARTN